jgi:hypothetical protein
MSLRPSHQSVLEASKPWHALDNIREVHKDLDLHFKENTGHFCCKDASLDVLSVQTNRIMLW